VDSRGEGGRLGTSGAHGADRAVRGAARTEERAASPAGAAVRAVAVLPSLPCVSFVLRPVHRTAAAPGLRRGDAVTFSRLP
jgi:hypothetical protein